jgi:hypothetical protein
LRQVYPDQPAAQNLGRDHNCGDLTGCHFPINLDLPPGWSKAKRDCD